jgi:type I restriction enzyme M protein
MVLQQNIDRITDTLRRDDGISGAMHYTEQISWILFLKYLNDYEEEKSNEALLEGRGYTYVLDEEYRWDSWACPKTKAGKLDLNRAMTGDDLNDFVNGELFPYLNSFRAEEQDVRTLRYKISSIFEFIDNRIASGHTLREVLDIIDEMSFQSKKDLFELSHVYENLLQSMGQEGGYAGEFYTPRSLIRAVVEAINPQVGQTVYDGAAGSCGFLIQAYDHMREKPDLSTDDWIKLQQETFLGREKTPLAYVMGVMNMILHGIEAPNIFKTNTLTVDIRGIQESDRHDVILANPPFGGKEKAQVQQNFPVKSGATELLFLQHFMRSLKNGGKAGVVVPEGILFQTGQAFAKVKQELLTDFNLHTIISLPAGVFLPYSGVKTNVIFFDRTGSTSDIWFYEVEPPYKLTKNKPIQYEHFAEFLKLYPQRADSEQSWTVKAADIKDYDISAKNPSKNVEVVHLPPKEILAKIRENEAEVRRLLDEIEALLDDGE